MRRFVGEDDGFGKGFKIREDFFPIAIREGGDFHAVGKVEGPFMLGMDELPVAAFIALLLGWLRFIGEELEAEGIEAHVQRLEDPEGAMAGGVEDDVSVGRHRYQRDVEGVDRENSNLIRRHRPLVPDPRFILR